MHGRLIQATTLVHDEQEFIVQKITNIYTYIQIATFHSVLRR
jgi:hypothetical protein